MARVLDFSSALYLGLRHGSDSLRPWESLTTGAPAALEPPPGAEGVARTLAALQGCERATLAPSTLHLFWDLFGLLAAGGMEVHVDAGVYPIARWGIERARARGAPVRAFRHHDPDSLRRGLRRAGKRRPVVVSDGLCPGCGGPAPLEGYLEAVRRHGGLLVVDDTQALGILGAGPGRGAPYGSGGGGSLRWHGAEGPEVLVVASLAKGLGVPAAVLAGSAAAVAAFEARSETRVHCSPPSAAALRAAERALEVNRRAGDALRLRLARGVRRFRERLRGAALRASGGLFPVQTLGSVPGLDAAELHERLLRAGVRTVLHRGRPGGEARIGFLLTAAHSPADIDHATAVLASAVGAKQKRRSPWAADLTQECSIRARA